MMNPKFIKNRKQNEGNAPPLLFHIDKDIKALGLDNRKMYYINYLLMSDEVRKEFTVKDFIDLIGLKELKTLRQYERDPKFNKALKMALTKRIQFKEYQIYECMYNRATNGDIKAAEWVLKYHKEIEKDAKVKAGDLLSQLSAGDDIE